MRRGHLLPASLFVFAIGLDVVSKRWAVDALSPMHVPHDVIGSVVRFTLAFNRGAAFGMHLGEWSRVFFGVVAVVIVGLLAAMYRESGPTDRLRRVALALIAGGAIGNLIDRVRWSGGVVDFIDIGTATWRFWTFNVADSAVTVGTILLLWVMRDEPPHTPAEPAHSASSATGS
jgi:signal peptidase II